MSDSGLTLSDEDLANKKDMKAKCIRAARLRGKRMTYREIADEMGVSVGTAHKYVQNAYKDAVIEATDLAREFERERLDKLWQKAEEIAAEEHYVTAHGKVVLHPETHEPLIDPVPKLQAYKEMRSIAESYRKLEGLDSPTKVEQTGNVEYKVVGLTSDL